MILGMRRVNPEQVEGLTPFREIVITKKIPSPLWEEDESEGVIRHCSP